MSNIGIDAPAAHPLEAPLRQHTIPRFRQAISLAVIFSPPGHPRAAPMPESHSP